MPDEEQEPAAEANPVGRMRGGGRTGEGVARPRDREAAEGDAAVEPGFTTTGPSGSAGGRALYGKDREEPAEPVDVDAADEVR